MNAEFQPFCGREGCNHFLTVHTRGLTLWDRCLHPGCGCQKAILVPKENPIKLKGTFMTGEKPVEQPVVETQEPKQVEQASKPTEKKPVSLGKEGQRLADAFITIAKANGGVVTMAQAKEVKPSAPSDLAYYARIRGSEITTNRKKGQDTTWTLVKENG